jgi:hypothetical protein
MKLQLDMFTKHPCQGEWEDYIITGSNVGKNLGWIVKYWNHSEYDSKVLYRICKIACRQNGYALEYVPVEHRTPEMCTIACTRHGLALEFVPYEHRTPELCAIACAENEWVMEFVPEEIEKEVKRRIK